MRALALIRVAGHQHDCDVRDGRRPVASASSMPSIPGIFTSLRSKSNSPLDALSASRAARRLRLRSGRGHRRQARARQKLERMSSSSAIRILAIALLRSGRSHPVRLKSAPSHRWRFPAARQSGCGNPASRRDRECCGPAARSKCRLPARRRRARQTGGAAPLLVLLAMLTMVPSMTRDDRPFLRFLRNPHIFEFQIAQIDRQADGRKQRSVCGKKRTTSLRAPISATLKANNTRMSAVQRDERRAWLRRACSRLRRAVKFSISSASDAVAASGDGRFDRRHQ